jgi:hypothetical protein
VETDEKIQISKNSEMRIEISINYITFGRSWNRMEQLLLMFLHII